MANLEISSLSGIDVLVEAESSTLATRTPAPPLSPVAWSAILAGAVVTVAASLALVLLGSGLGLTMLSPWSFGGHSVATFAVSTAIWLVVVQWISSALGGYLTGRLRTRWAGVRPDEVFFRDTAHGFISWALATLFVAGFLALSLTSLAGSGPRMYAFGL